MSHDEELVEALGTLSSAVSDLQIGSPHHTVLRSGAAYQKPDGRDEKLSSNLPPKPSHTTSSSQTEQPHTTTPMADKPQNVILRGEDKNPKYTGSEETGPDLLTHLQRVEDAFTKFQYTNEKEKLAHLYNSIHTGPCRAQSIIKSDAFKKAKTYEEAKANLISHFGSTCKQGPLSVLFRLAATYRTKIKANIAVDDCLGVAGSAFTEFESQFRHSPWTTDEKMNLEDVCRLSSPLFLSVLSRYLFAPYFLFLCLFFYHLPPSSVSLPLPLNQSALFIPLFILFPLFLSLFSSCNLLSRDLFRFQTLFFLSLRKRIVSVNLSLKHDFSSFSSSFIRRLFFGAVVSEAQFFFFILYLLVFFNFILSLFSFLF